jgi:hypothetical protein
VAFWSCGCDTVRKLMHQTTQQVNKHWHGRKGWEKESNTTLRKHRCYILIFPPYSFFSLEKWVYTQFSPRKNEYILRFPPGKMSIYWISPPEIQVCVKIEQELISIAEQHNSPVVLCRVSVARSLVFCVMSLFALFVFFDHCIVLPSFIKIISIITVARLLDRCFQKVQHGLYSRTFKNI